MSELEQLGQISRDAMKRRTAIHARITDPAVENLAAIASHILARLDMEAIEQDEFPCAAIRDELRKAINDVIGLACCEDRSCFDCKLEDFAGYTLRRVAD
jgi:hypothetical protein